MAEAFAWLDAQPESEARAALRRCCGSERWVERMLARRPFGSAAAMHDAARETWADLTGADRLEAFAQHPAIGADLTTPGSRFAATAAWSADEQSGVAGADARTVTELQAANRDYRDRFGYVFLVCATGKTAAEMLAALRARLRNAREDEFAIASAEQEKITHLRLEKLGG